MTPAECEIVANAGVQLREIAQRITVPAHVIYADLDVAELLTTMDRAALAISEVYGALASLPLDNEPERAYGRFEQVDETTVRWVT